ncbi:MAG TPA: sigma 54-interacting transcriptional regulator [Polyangiaceae bacterium]|nr:sigma 54-interacting transcriptional regulator [Polyangiaceae bacterium]
MIPPGTSRIRAEQRGISIPSIELVVIDGPARGTRVRVEDGLARVGSAAGSDLSLADFTVSRVHCEIRVHPTGISIKDCGSTNGTFVEGVNVREGDVQPGAAVRVGRSVFRIESVDGHSVVPISDNDAFGELVGASLAMRQVYAILERIAPTHATLLIEGETGTGKDVAARSLHAASTRASGPFVPVDCGAIPENLIESELFGHVRGAFSGAVSDRRGVFEEAHGGTLFLDEIGEMPLSVQSKLLRALETRSVRRVGGNTERSVDVRIVAATNRPLAICANQGTFREDLYYRLAVVDVTLPPLRARVEDIPKLASHFFARFSGSEAPLPDTFIAMLLRRSWPGNVRELRNFIERSVSLGSIHEPLPTQRSSSMPPASLPATAESLVPLHLPLKDARQAWTESFESVYVRAMLKKTGGNLTRAAELAGVNRRFMQRLLARLGLRASDVALDADDEK